MEVASINPTMSKFLPLAFLVLLLSSCIGDESPATELRESLQGSRWRVDFFEDEGRNETSDFANWELEFAPDGVLRAYFNQGLSASGTWRTVRDDGQEELWLSLPGFPKLEELNEDWYVVERRDNLIRMEDQDENFIDKLHLRRN